MIATVNLINIYHLIDTKKERKQCFPACAETFRIYHLSNFQIHHTAVLTMITMLYITAPGFIYPVTGSLYRWTPPLPSPSNHKSHINFRCQSFLILKIRPTIDYYLSYGDIQVEFSSVKLLLNYIVRTFLKGQNHHERDF